MNVIFHSILHYIGYTFEYRKWRFFNAKYTSKKLWILCVSDKQIDDWSPNMKQNIWELSGLHEGDIMEPMHEMEARNGMRDDSLRWEGGEVPYHIHSDFGKLHAGKVETFVIWTLKKVLYTDLSSTGFSRIKNNNLVFEFARNFSRNNTIWMINFYLKLRFLFADTKFYSNQQIK